MIKYSWLKTAISLIVLAIVMSVTPGTPSTGIAVVEAQGPVRQQRAIVGNAVMPGVSSPVRLLARVEPQAVGVSPTEVNPRHANNMLPKVNWYNRTPIVQSSIQSTMRATTVITSFDGIDFLTGGAGEPPDTVGDVGPNHYVQAVNSSFAIFNKNGTMLTGPTNINALWSDGTPCQTQNQGDPIVLYDRLAGRWVISQFNFVDQNTPPFYQCFAVSQTSDPTGAYYTYSFAVSNDVNVFNDYGKIGVWPDGYYMGANEAGFTAYVFDRQNMLTGAAATFQKFNINSNFMLPSDLDGATAPPAGTPNHFYTMSGDNAMELWAFHVDWATSGNSTFTKVSDLTSGAGFIYDVCPALPSDKNSLDCIPQPGTTQALDAIGEWPMYRFQYRNFGDHESLVGNFTTDMNAGAGTDHAGIHWFELRRTGTGNWSIFNEGNYAPDGNERWLGSAAMDKKGNIAVGYSASNGTDIFPSLRYATRNATDPAGQLGAETTLHAGAAAQTSSNRWGDYSSMNVDPVDDCTFWFTSEYLQSSANGWRTRVGTFKIPSCDVVYTNWVYLPLVLK